MNSQGNYKDDLLRQYIAPEKREEAPDGFTSRVMLGIKSEAAPVMVKGYTWRKNIVPVVSAMVTVLLIVAAYLIPESQAETVDLPVLNLLKNIKLSIPEIDLSSVFKLTFPSVTLYIIIGIVCLTVFDKALSVIFKRR